MHIWPERLPKAWIPIVTSSDTPLFASAVSLLEIGIKYAKFGDAFGVDPDLIVSSCRDTQIEIVDIHTAILIPSTRLPHHHKDPFDRLIIAQASAMQARVMTTDKIFKSYDIELVNY